LPQARDANFKENQLPNASAHLDGNLGAGEEQPSSGPPTRRKYFWTPELNAVLIEAYQAPSKRVLSQRLSKLVLQTGWPRPAIRYQASLLGITTTDHRREWTAEEDDYLAERIGEVSASAIADHLKRSVPSVESRAERLQMSRRRSGGYCASDLQRCFGVSYSRADSWLRRGLLGKVHQFGGVNGNRVTEENVMRFIRNYPREYDLRRVDQVWFVAMVFGRAADEGSTA